MDEIQGDYHLWRPATWLHVTGPDAASFLQSQFSNDLRALGGVESVYGLWLNQKGRVLADSFILKAARPDSFWVGSYFSPAQVVIEHLEGHLVADEVAIEDQTDRWQAITIFGQSGTMKCGDDETVSFPGRRGGGMAREFLMKCSPVTPRGRSSSREEMEYRRISDGIPAVPQDIGPGDLPQEGGLEVDAVSFAKGCYLGQEVMARLNSLGTPRRRLFRVAGKGRGLPAGVMLQLAGKPIGELRSAVVTPDGFVGLAMLQLAAVKAGQTLSAQGVAEIQVLAAV